jgi:hypothetical protein
MDFNTDSQIEVFTEGNQYLFTDRDNSPVGLAIIERDVESSRMVLNKTSDNDCLRDASGVVTATIEIIERRGVPIYHPKNGLYGIDKALDNSNETYWGEVILSDQPLKVKMIT